MALQYKGEYMVRNILESISYQRSSTRTREICRELSQEFRIRECRIYGLLRGSRARSNTEMKIIYRLMDRGIIRKIKS